MQGVLEYPVDKTKLVVNRDAEDIGIKADFLEEKLGISICARIPSDGRLAVQAANTGLPFVLSSPKAPISQGIRELAQTIAGGEDLAAAAGMGGANPGFFGKILHRLRA
jgi:pilus assembly protein CpaE